MTIRQEQPVRRALVTGGGRRIGRVLARQLADDGWDVAVHYNHSRDGAEAVCDEIRAIGRRAISISADLSEANAVSNLMGAAMDQLGPLDLLVNSASLYGPDNLSTLTLESWRRLVDINLTAPIFLMQAFANQGVTPVHASIVNVLDQQITTPSPEYFSYFVAKIGLEGATRLAALDLAPSVRVNAVAPGLVLKSAGQTHEQFVERQRIMPLGIGLGPVDIADAVIYLANARHVTGQTIYVDSGQRLMGPGNTKRGA